MHKSCQVLIRPSCDDEGLWLGEHPDPPGRTRQPGSVMEGAGSRNDPRGRREVSPGAPLYLFEASCAHHDPRPDSHSASLSLAPR